MKRTLMAAAALLLASTAFAADMAVKAPPPVPDFLPAGAPGSWNAFYIGANVGFGRDDFGVTGIPGANGTGALGGIQIGHNWQVGQHFLWGTEVDFDWTDMKQNNVGGVNGLNAKLPRLGTARLRAGIVNNAWLFYVTGGAAFGQENVAVLGNMSAVGWTAGAGVEYKFARSWSLKAEYLHFDTTPLSGALSINSNGDIGRIGINYLFQ